MSDNVEQKLRGAGRKVPTGTRAAVSLNSNDGIIQSCDLSLPSQALSCGHLQHPL